jgi:hypothetical protein
VITLSAWRQEVWFIQIKKGRSHDRPLSNQETLPLYIKAFAALL